MRVVNLARKPFHNRRPVSRAAAALWVLAAILLAVNLWKWGGHFRGSSDSGDRLDLLERQVKQEEQKLDDYWDELQQVRLGARNQKARYLNVLIHRRTFPWSRLFDQLEEVLPDNVYLEKVVPKVELASLDRRQTAQRATRSLSRSEARARARQRASGQAPAADNAPRQDATQAVLSDVQLRDRVELTLAGYARTEDALLDFVDLLYRHDSFLDPVLGRENQKEDGGGVVDFNIRAVYLTPLREVFPVQIEELPPEAGEVAEQGEGSLGGDSEDGVERVAASAEGDAGQDGAARLSTSTGAGSDTAIEPGQTRATALQAEGEVAEEASGADRSREDAVRETLRQRQEQAERRQAAREASRERGSRDGSGREVESSRGSARTGSASPPRTGSSRVSVAPRRSQSTPDASSGDDARSARPAPSRTPRSVPNRTPRRESLDRPAPIQPAASASPRLRGMLEWLPSFLRPELSMPGDVPGDVGPGRAETEEAA